MSNTTKSSGKLDSFLAGLTDDRWLRVMRYREIDARRPNPHLAPVIDTMLTTRPDRVMPEAEQHEARKRLFNVVLSATREGNDQVQIYADLIWGRLSPDDKRQLAINSTLAPSIIMEVMRNDPVLAPKIVVHIDQTPVRGIESYLGSAAVGVIGMHYAALREQDSARAAEVRQYAELRLSSADIGTLSAVGMDRTLFDRYLRDGFTQTQILCGARDANVLGFRGREDIDIAMNAPPELRAAALAIIRAEAPATKEAARRRYQEVRERLQQQYPPNDPRQDHMNNFDRRIQTINGMFVDRMVQNGVEATRALSTNEQVETTIQSLGKRQAETLRATVAATSANEAVTKSDKQRLDVAAAEIGDDPASARRVWAEPSATPDTKIAADQAMPGMGQRLIRRSERRPPGQ